MSSSAPTTSLDEQYDALVKATVRRAWDKAWGDYQSGRWLHAAPSMLIEGAIAATAAAAVTTQEEIDQPPLLPQSRSSRAATQQQPPRQHSSALYEYDDVHPHKPASNKPPPLPYGARERQRLKVKEEVRTFRATARW